MRITLIHEHGIELSPAKEYVLTDSVLFLGDQIAEYPQSVQSWKNRIEWFTQSPTYRELDNKRRTSRVRVEDFPRAHFAEALPGSLKHDGERSHSDRKLQGSNHLHVGVQ